MNTRFSNQDFIKNISPGLEIIHKRTLERNISIGCGVAVLLFATLLFYQSRKEVTELEVVVAKLRGEIQLQESKFANLVTEQKNVSSLPNPISNPIAEHKPEYEI